MAAIATLTLTPALVTAFTSSATLTLSQTVIPLAAGGGALLQTALAQTNQVPGPASPVPLIINPTATTFEVVSLIGINGDTIQVARGAGGSTAQSHVASMPLLVADPLTLATTVANVIQRLSN